MTAKKILFVATEAVPFVSTGGLGDVIGSLPAALKKLGGDSFDIRVILPLYKSVDNSWLQKMEKVCETTIPLSWRNQYAGVYSVIKDDVTFYFIDNEYYFSRRFLYGSFDDGERFAYFSKAVIELMPKLDFIPDIIHAHDWQSALSVIYLKNHYLWRKEYSNVKTVFTIHNIEYQGVYGFDIFNDIFDLRPEDRQTVEYGGLINLMKGAIVSCDALTTVSPSYAGEILTPEYSQGLHPVLELNKAKLMGIINGIDINYYNAACDPDIYTNFTADDICGKAKDKEELQKLLGLPEKADTPLITMITRLASHKGVDLLTHAVDELLSKDVQFVLLGTGDYHYEEFFKRLSENYPAKAASLITYNKELSKKIYAAADIFLMPSKSEPCGLAQMIASRYGAVPIVRNVGGLRDTIHEPDNGFTFNHYNSGDMLYAINRALEKYADKDEWQKLVIRVMKTDFSWDVSAKKYAELYDTFA
ncbi:MAG: glycogen synthase GlgA [Eubacteriales bacterium]|nr:glycogen synthase GlgA [Eubacteriales bacterium]MDD4475576.1 glycogen synthase GlgA [Eubacteriales bacterium]